MATNIKKINLDKFKPEDSTTYTGRIEGSKARKDLHLSEFDKDEKVEVEFTFPEDTTSINPSFFLGLLYESFKNLGETKFLNKYKFKFENEVPEIIEALNENIQDALRTANNNYKGNISIFDSFLNRG